MKDAERRKNTDQNNNAVNQPALIDQPQENKGVQSKRQKNLEEDVAIGIHIFIISINIFTISMYASENTAKVSPKDRGTKVTC